MKLCFKWDYGTKRYVY